MVRLTIIFAYSVSHFTYWLHTRKYNFFMSFKLLIKFFSCVHVSAPRRHGPMGIPEQ